MAGLAGIVPLRDTIESTETVTLVEKMARLQSHRGRGEWRVVSHPGLVHLVPYEDSAPHVAGGLDERHGGKFLAFDGEITNCDEIRTQLDKAGAELRSTSDRDLVLCAWEKWGEQCLDHLHGRFAFVLHDSATGASFLVRDRFGHRPFHYTFSDGRLCFASEIKALLAVTGPPALDELALLEWSLYGDVLPPRTLFRGIRTLGPGYLLRVDKDGRTQEFAYYDPANVVDPALYAEYAARSTPELLDILESTIDHAVTSHINGRPEVGVMLSGGVDLAVVAALASRHAKVRAYNFSVAGDTRLDERPMANEVARILGLPLKGIVIDGETYRRELARATYHCEMPLWHMHAVPIHLVARFAADNGTSLLLSGFSLGPILTAAPDRYRWVVPPSLLSRVPDDLFRVVRKAVYSAPGFNIANPFFAAQSRRRATAGGRRRPFQPARPVQPDIRVPERSGRSQDSRHEALRHRPVYPPFLPPSRSPLPGGVRRLLRRRRRGALHVACAQPADRRPLPQEEDNEMDPEGTRDTIRAARDRLSKEDPSGCAPRRILRARV